MSKSFVYEITNSITKAVYVGKSNNPTKRFETHMRASNRGSPYLTNAIKKYGISSFVLNIIADFDNEEEAYQHERDRIEEYIKLGHEIYNLCAGGRGIIMTPQLHKKMTSVWKNPKRLKNISAASLNNWKNLSFRNKISYKVKEKFKDPDFKKLHSKATREGMTLDARGKISAVHKGRVQSEIEKASRSKGCKDYWAANEDKRKERSILLSCDKNPNAKISVIDVIRCRTLNLVFNINASQISRILSISSRSARDVVAGNTWKSIHVEHDGYLTEESLKMLEEILKIHTHITPSLKTKNLVKLTEFSLKDDRIVQLYREWKTNNASDVDPKVLAAYDRYKEAQ